MTTPQPVIHQTDLFLPPADPDDHYDLATQFALVLGGDTELLGVLLDAPPEGHGHRDPAVVSLAQLASVTGIATPFMVGRSELWDSTGRSGLGAGARFLLSLLESSRTPVDVHIVGSCRDAAEAATYAPEIFEKMCRRLYLNAGSSSPIGDAPGQREYNIELDVKAYIAMFNLPCPTYWMPCFTNTGERIVSEFSTHWQFNQREFVGGLHGRLRSYFEYALSAKRDPQWLRSLGSSTLDPVPDEQRSMWCTAGFLDSAGLQVSADGAIHAKSEGVFEFVDVDWSVDETGHVRWSRSSTTSGLNKIFRVTDLTNYERAMTSAMKRLFSRIEHGSPGD